MTQWFRMQDDPSSSSPAIAITREEAARWNTPDQGFGIFMTVNSFDGPRRKENLRKIDAWAIDMDDGSKDQQRAKLHSSPLVPTLIVETKRGYQAYWAAKGGKPEHWNAIVLERLVPFFGADKNARDLCRILRVPGYLHLKDPKDPFLVRIAWRHDVSYTEQQVGFAFPWIPDEQTRKAIAEEAKRAAASAAREQAQAAGVAFAETFWEAVYRLDCEEGLRRLSGHWTVRGESFTFKPTSKGHLNIFVDKKSTPCFVDEHKRIGSPSNGGPTLARWIAWYGHDVKVQIATLKEIFPRLVEIDDAARKAWRAA